MLNQYKLTSQGAAAYLKEGADLMACLYNSAALVALAGTADPV